MAEAGGAADAARFLVVTPDAQYADDGEIERATGGGALDFAIHRQRDAAALPAGLLARADALLVYHEVRIDAAVIAGLERCRIIVRAGVGYDHIDVAAAGAAGIAVCNTPDYGTSEVADHAIALMLAFARGIAAFQPLLTADPAGNFRPWAAPFLMRLRGRRLGIVGCGRIGTATALRARALGMDVVFYDPYLPGQEIALGLGRVGTLRELLAASHVVSLHTPLTEETRGLIDAAALAAMRPDAVLVNTARGAVVDTDALLAALRDGRIAAAGLDVLPVEPADPADPLVAAFAAGEPALAGRLLLTPHAAWNCPDSEADARRLSTETTRLFLCDGTLRNCVNDPWLRPPTA